MNRQVNLSSRRQFLRGSGAMLALPVLESALPKWAQAAEKAPQRLLFYFVPNGMHMPAWTPSTEGTDYELTPILKPLEKLRSELLVISGLSNLPGRPDGAGDHAGGTSAFLTCAHALKSETELRLGVSVDQLAASKLGQGTRFASLPLGMEGGASVGGCDSGYSCAYSQNISWIGPKTPLAKIAGPQLLFDLLFQDGAQTMGSAEKRNRHRQSVLDFVLRDAHSLRGRISRSDRDKLDEYMHSIREVEQRLQTLSTGCDAPGPPTDDVRIGEQLKAMSDLMVLALRCDLTRVMTFMLGNGGSNRPYDFLPNVKGAHHELSHHRNQPSIQAQLQTIDTWEVEQLGYLLNLLKTTKDRDGSTLLDSTLVIFASEVSDGNSHDHTGLPVLLAGRLGGTVRPGRHLRRNEPIANLYTSILNAVGVPSTKFGEDGTGPLQGLS